MLLAFSVVLLTSATAVAPDPPPPVILTCGEVVYPYPPDILLK